MIGWSRSGTYLYYPVLHDACCPHYQIRLNSKDFLISSSQKKVLRRITRYVKLSDQFVTGEKDEGEEEDEKEEGKREDEGKGHENGKEKQSKKGDNIVGGESSRLVPTERQIQLYFEKELRDALLKSLIEVIEGNSELRNAITSSSFTSPSSPSTITALLTPLVSVQVRSVIWMPHSILFEFTDI